MGRPSLKVKGTQVRLPLGLPERIDVLEGPNKRAEFIRRVVVEAIEREEQTRGIVPPSPPAEAPKARRPKKAKPS